MSSIESQDKFSLQSDRELKNKIKSNFVAKNTVTIDELQKEFDEMQQFIDLVISIFKIADFQKVKQNLLKGFDKYASNWVHQQQRQQFIKLFQSWQFYNKYQNKQKQFSKISDDDIYVLQTEAKINIQLLMGEKHQILDQEKLFQYIMSNQLEDAGIFVKYTDRDNFMNKVRCNQKIKRYWMRTNSQKIRDGPNVTSNKIKYSKWITDLQKQVENYFQIVKDIYGTIVKSQITDKITMNELIFSKIKSKYDKTANITFFSEMMRLKIFEQIGQSSNKYIQNNGNPPLSIIETSKIKDKLVFFDINKYYERVNNTYYSIYKQKLQSSLNVEKLLTLKMKVIEQFGAVKKKEIFQIINKYLRKFGYQMINQRQFNTLSQDLSSSALLKIDLKVRCIKDNAQLNQQKQPKSSLSLEELSQIRQLMYSYTFQSLVKTIQNEIGFSQQIRKLTNWSYIKQLIDQYLQGKRREINQHILNILNQELRQLSIQINSEDNILQFIEQFEKNKSKQNKNQKIKTLNFVQSSYLKNHQKDLQSILQELSYFDGNVIRYNIIKRKDIEDKSFFYIASLSQVIMQLKRQYKQKTDLFNSDQMRQSIYTQIKKNTSFNTLFQKINDIIAQSPSKLDKIKMKEIYLGINILLANFNEDLALASHRLTQTFTNQVHLYAIHCIWKKISDEELNIANKEYESYCKSKEQQFAALINKHNNCQ